LFVDSLSPPIVPSFQPLAGIKQADLSDSIHGRSGATEDEAVYVLDGMYGHETRIEIDEHYGQN
jgi:hypothetical protein